MPRPLQKIAFVLEEFPVPSAGQQLLDRFLIFTPYGFDERAGRRLLLFADTIDRRPGAVNQLSITIFSASPSDACEPINTKSRRTMCCAWPIVWKKRMYLL